MRAQIEVDVSFPTAPGFRWEAGGVVRAGGPQGLQLGRVVEGNPKEPGSSVLVLTIDLPDCEVYL